MIDVAGIQFRMGPDDGVRTFPEELGLASPCLLVCSQGRHSIRLLEGGVHSLIIGTRRGIRSRPNPAAASYGVPLVEHHRLTRRDGELRLVKHHVRRVTTI